MSTVIDEVRASIQDQLDELLAEVEPLQNALKALSDNGSPTATEAPEMAPESPQKSQTATTRRSRASFSDEAIIDIVKAHPNCGAAKIRENLGGSSNAMSMRLTKLVKAGQLTRLGERRNTHYRIPVA